MAGSREQIEELLELWWTAAEDGLVPLDRNRLPQQLRCFLPHPIEPTEVAQQDTIETMLRQGLLSADERGLRLSALGNHHARNVVRRHRLAEVLLYNVLAVSEASTESTACQVEHILNDEVTEAVCVFLGHPPTCPHGRLIPRDRCCDTSVSTVHPLLIPLSSLAIGEEAAVALIHTARQDYLKRLSALGVAPGRRVRLRQTRPALVIQVGETELALDPEAGQEILVSRRKHASSAGLL